jgi:hypothetical protein
MYYIVIGICAVLLIWAIGSYLVIRNIEVPSYIVLEKRDGYEIRSYQAYMVAETEVKGPYSDALTAGFGIIANYIFGGNTSQTSIAMTAPVLENTSEKIAMTAPVLNNSTSSQTRIISFVLPSKYTADTLPTPKDARVTITEVPSRTVAALRFNWYATQKRVEQKTNLIHSYLERDNIKFTEPTQVAQYNPPLSFPVTRRNEILVPLSQD